MYISNFQYDFADVYAWQSRITQFEFPGLLDWRVTVFDTASDGSYLWRHEDFTDGIRSEMTEVDNTYGSAESGQRAWQYRVTGFDETGQKASMIIRYDSQFEDVDAQLNGLGEQVYVMQYNTYDEGALNTILYQDVVEYSSGLTSLNSTAKNWREKLVTYNDDHEISHQHVVFDNGSVRDVSYREDGARFALHQDGDMFGEADIFVWETRLDAFGSDRQLSYRLQKYDNGDVRLILHEDGDVVLNAFEDIADTQTWYGSIKTFDPDSGQAQIAYYDTVLDYDAALPEDWAVIV